MPRTASGGVTASWDPDDGILRLHMTKGCAPGAEDANRIADAVEAWTGLTSPMRALIDCEGATGLYLGWRVAWTMRITKHKRPVRLAYHNWTGMAGWIMPYFALVTGLDAKGFNDARAAEAWLNDRSFITTPAVSPA